MTFLESERDLPLDLKSDKLREDDLSRESNRISIESCIAPRTFGDLHRRNKRKTLVLLTVLPLEETDDSRSNSRMDRTTRGALGYSKPGRSDGEGRAAITWRWGCTSGRGERTRAWKRLACFTAFTRRRWGVFVEFANGSPRMRACLWVNVLPWRVSGLSLVIAVDFRTPHGQSPATDFRTNAFDDLIFFCRVPEWIVDPSSRKIIKRPFRDDIYLGNALSSKETFVGRDRIESWNGYNEWFMVIFFLNRISIS